MTDVEKAIPQLGELRKQNLETDIVSLLAQKLDVDAQTALDVYYRSELCQQIAENVYGIQNLDAAYLVDDLFENEPELFMCEERHEPLGEHQRHSGCSRERDER